MTAREFNVREWLEELAARPPLERRPLSQTAPLRPEPTVEMILPTATREIRIPVHIAHLYVPRETPNYGGNDHVMVELGFKLGRIEREPGQTLCLWRRRKGSRGGGAFDKVEATREPTCKKCIEILHRLGASLEVTQYGESS